MDFLEKKKKYILAAIIAHLAHPERGTVALFVKQKLLDAPGSISINFNDLRVNDQTVIEETTKILISLGLVAVEAGVLKMPVGEPCVTCGKICPETCKRREEWKPGTTIPLPQNTFPDEHGGSITERM